MQDFDVIIIGSGMGGLVCGNLLALEGYKVCVLEKNKQIGGCLQTYVRDRVIFDSGVHYLGGLEKGQNLYQIFKYLNILDRLKLQKMDEEVFDKILFENDPKEYVFAQGYENFISRLLVDFPEEEKALRIYCDKIKEVCSKFPLYNLRSGGDEHEKADVLTIDTKGYIDSITSNPVLREVLAGNNPLYAGQPDKTPFYVHALILNSYIESSYKCIDGGSQIAKYLSRNILDLGGAILRHRDVRKIIVEEGKASSVEMADGFRMSAGYVISNVHPVKTLEMTETDLIKKVYRNRLKHLENSIGCFTLNIVFKPNSFKYVKYNYYVYNEGCVWKTDIYTEDTWPLGYAAFFGASSKSPEYAEGMTILAYMKYEEVRQWDNTHNTVDHEEDRGDEYDAFKHHKAELLLDYIERKFPDIRSHIKAYYTATPLSYRDYIGTEDGSLYGIAKDYKDSLKTFISPRTKLPNLFFTGQNLNLHGVLGAAMSGIVTANALLGNDDLINKIRNA